MKVISETNKYYKYAFEYQFSMELLDFCRWIKQRIGWQEFGFSNGKWRFNNLAVVNIIKGKYPEVEIDESLQNDWRAYQIKRAQEELVVEKANEIKTKTISDLVVKGLKKELYPFQLIGVEFFINNNGRAILADQCGMGKTITSLAYIVHENFGKTLVVCPASVKYNWEKEILETTHLKPFVFDSHFFNKESKNVIDTIKKYDVFIINYDILRRFIEVAGDIRFDCLVSDEVTYVKSNQAIRTRALKLIAKKIPHILLLSGTPLLNRTVELFNPLNILDGETWKNWKQFTINYCNGHDDFFGWNAKGSSNLPELKEKISKYFLRRKKEDVLKELPPKQLIDFPVEMNSESKFNYDLVMSSFKDYLLEIKKKSFNEVKRSLQAEKLVRIGELRQITTNAKLEAATEIIQNIIDSEEKVVVFSSYNEPLKKLHKKFEDISVLILGDTPTMLRQKMIEVFQNKNNVKVFFGGIGCTGMGINLTISSNVLFLNMPWVPAEKEQCIDRCHRIGSVAESINVYNLYIPNTIDDYMRKILIEKQKIFDKLFDKPLEDVKQTSIIEDLIKEIQKEV